LSEFTNLLISGIVVAMIVGAGRLAYDAFKKDKPIKFEYPSEIGKSNFRNRVAEEVITILRGLDNMIVVPSTIPNPVWGSVTSHEKTQLLGDDHYRSTNAFFKAVEKSNEITGKADQRALQNAAQGGKSYQPVIREAERIFAEINWLKPRKDEVQDLFSRLEGRYNLRSYVVSHDVAS
jgi:hypothetical protein